MIINRCPKCGKNYDSSLGECPHCKNVTEITSDMLFNDMSSTSQNNIVNEKTKSSQDISSKASAFDTSLQNQSEKKPKKKIKPGLIIVIAVIIVLFVVRGVKNKDKYDPWPTTGLATLLPQPNSGKYKVHDFSDTLNIDVLKTDKDTYENYVSECKDKGFTVEAEETTDEYYAFNTSGNKIELQYWDRKDSFDISITAAKKLQNITWPVIGLAELIPQPESLMGDIYWDSSEYFVAYIGDTSLDDFSVYVEKCMQSGFNIDYHKADKYFTAKDSAGNSLDIQYQGFNIIEIYLRKAEEDIDIAESSPDVDKALPTSTPEPTPEPTVEPTQEPQTDNTLIRGEVKQAIDSYEDFIDEYCAFMKSYDYSNINMLTEYMNLLSREAEMAQKFDAIDDQDLTDAEEQYYLDVSLRCSQKMLACASSMN